MELEKPRRQWRKLIKKIRRKRKRTAEAQERDKKLEEENAIKLADPLYQQWIQEQNLLEESQKQIEQHQRGAEEEEWIRREHVAQHQFRVESERRQADEIGKEFERLKQEKELQERETAQRKRREEKVRLAAEAMAEFENIMNKMELYLSDVDISTPMELTRYVETRPNQKLCEFYKRTNCCRYGITCKCNHKRPLLARILLIHHFFMHPLLDTSEHQEYDGADSYLESSEQDLRDDYDAFFEDVVPELETFGKIVNFRTARNILSHLRGNVFVEYQDKRSALRAFTNLQGRYYASKPLVVEFSNIVTWRGAVCGLSVARKCTRGNVCSFLHLFKNPGNKYNTPLENTKDTQQPSTRKNQYLATPLLTWNDVCSSNLKNNDRNWRWSESPEPELSSPQQLDVNQISKDSKSMELNEQSSSLTMRKKAKKISESDKDNEKLICDSTEESRKKLPSTIDGGRDSLRSKNRERPKYKVSSDSYYNDEKVRKSCYKSNKTKSITSKRKKRKHKHKKDSSDEGKSVRKKRKKSNNKETHKTHKKDVR